MERLSAAHCSMFGNGFAESGGMMLEDQAQKETSDPEKRGEETFWIH
jgi:hypothetical protein